MVPRAAPWAFLPPLSAALIQAETWHTFAHALRENIRGKTLQPLKRFVKLIITEVWGVIC